MFYNSKKHLQDGPNESPWHDSDVVQMVNGRLKEHTCLAILNFCFIASWNEGLESPGALHLHVDDTQQDIKCTKQLEFTLLTRQSSAHLNDG